MSSQRTDVAVSSPGYATRYGAGPVRQHGRTPSMPLSRVELDGKRPARIRSQVVASAAHFADFLVVAIAGAASFALQPGFSWPLPPLPALTAALVLPMMTRRRNPNARQAEEFTQQGFSRHFGDGAAYALSAFGFALVTAIAVLQPDPAERGPLVAWLLFWAVASLAGITAVRAVLSVLQARWRAAGRLKQLVAVYGTGDLAERLLARLAGCTESIEIVGVFDERAGRGVVGAGLLELPRGTTAELVELSRQLEIDRIVVALPHSAEKRLLEILRKLHKMPVEISLAPTWSGSTSRARITRRSAGCRC